MRTVETKVFKFDELSEDAQQKAISNYLSTSFEYFWNEENRETLTAFENHFPVNVKDWEYGYQNYINFEFTQTEEISELTGIRLLKYLVNHYQYILFAPKYYGKLIDHEKDADHPAGKEHVKRYSKCQGERNCNLTGFWLDEEILDPIYDFLKNPKDSITFYDLMKDCLYSWIHACNKDYEASQEDEAVSDFLTANEYEFTEDGEIF